MNSLTKRTQTTVSAAVPKRRLSKRLDLSNALPQFRHDMDIAFDRMWRNMRAAWPKAAMPWPALQMWEDNKFLHIRLEAPGIDPENIDVELSGNLLTLRGTKESQRNENKSGIQRHERIAGCFYRTVSLPEHVDGSQIEARYDKGVLNIQLPKLPGREPRRIPITS